MNYQEQILKNSDLIEAIDAWSKLTDEKRIASYKNSMRFAKKNNYGRRVVNLIVLMYWTAGRIHQKQEVAQ